MDIKNQVCSIEQARKLKQLGILQGISHIYVYFGDTGTNCDHYIVRERTNDYQDDLCADAFTVAELGQMLGRFARNTSSLLDDGNEAIDRADDLIHLIELGELDVDLCNKKLTD